MRCVGKKPAAKDQKARAGVVLPLGDREVGSDGLRMGYSAANLCDGRPKSSCRPVRKPRGLRLAVPADGVAGGTIDCFVRLHFTPALRDHRVRRCAVGSRVLVSRLADAMRSSNDGSSLQKEARELCGPTDKMKRDRPAQAQDNLSPLAAGRAWKFQARDYDCRPRGTHPCSNASDAAKT